MVIVTETAGEITDEPSTTSIYNVYNQSYNMKDNIPSSYISDILQLFNTIKDYTLKIYLMIKIKLEYIIIIHIR
jgi:hypothetical protein